MLFLVLNYYYWSTYKAFSKKYFCFFFSLFYLLEYILILRLKNQYIYFLFIYWFYLKENFSILIFKREFFAKKIPIPLKKKIKKKSYVDKVWRIYYDRWKYYGWSIFYIQRFLRIMREKRNYIKYMHFYKWKWNYYYLKKKIRHFGLFFFFYVNYKIIKYFDKIFYRIIKYFIILNYIKLYYKALLNNILFFKLKKKR